VTSGIGDDLSSAWVTSVTLFLIARYPQLRRLQWRIQWSDALPPPHLHHHRNRLFGLQSALHSQVPSRFRHFDLQLVIPVGRLISVTPVWCSTRGPRGPSFGLSWVSDGFWVGYLVLPISTTPAPQSLPPNPTLPPLTPSWFGFCPSVTKAPLKPSK